MLKSIELSGFKSFAKKTQLDFKHPVSAIVGPNGSGKSNCAEAFRFVLGEQSVKSMRGKKNEDLIFNGSRVQPRSNRAAVKIIFDNSNRLLNVDFDDVVIERIVHRDGTNTYAINGSTVRLKDVAEMLAGANIGSSGHHIISQGEADRILNVSPKERKGMIEDALGLKKYLYKKKESERKLDKTEENIHEVGGLRKEIKPHLNYLKKQVSKIEHVKVLKDELVIGFREYLAHEDAYLKHAKKNIDDRRIEPLRKQRELADARKNIEAVLERSKTDDPFEEYIGETEKNLSEIRNQKADITREIGRIEGEISAEERLVAREEARQQRSEVAEVPQEVINTFKSEVSVLIARGKGLFDLGMVKELLGTIQEHVETFFDAFKESDNTGFDSEESKRRLEELKSKKHRLSDDLREKTEKESALLEKLHDLRGKQEAHNREYHEAEKRYLELKSEAKDIENQLARLDMLEDQMKSDADLFNQDMREVGFLLGSDTLRFEQVVITEKSRDDQRSMRRDLEKKKVKYEDSDVGSHKEVLKEYEDLLARDEFLEKEIGDLTRTKESLENLIKELKHKLDTEFKEGVGHINNRFGDFFKSMFGSGTANLSLAQYKKQLEGEDEPEIEYGLDINVSLPHKKIKGLEMLSGGERALTSIALLFAISQLNPPPFIILDETDAALDEANSRKYGDMIEALSGHSQLVVITHNRETMSRAGLLYGVTMGGDGVSKILTVEFDDALSVAK